MKNLWGLPQGIIPINILRDQTKHLEKMSSGLLTTSILSNQVGEYGICHYFYLVAPVINYRYLICRVEHSVTTIYPVFVSSFSCNEKKIAQNTEEFLDALQTLFHDEKVRLLISNLIATSVA